MVPSRAWAGEAVIRTLMVVNGRLATRCLALGPYLQDIARQYCAAHRAGLLLRRRRRHVSPGERAGANRNSPAARIFRSTPSSSSWPAASVTRRIPKPCFEAVAAARARGLNAVLLNLGGGYEQFLALARSIGHRRFSEWVLARPAVHPMTELADYMRAADALVQGSLEEGLGLSPLEALACEVPVVATRVGGMAAHLGEYATLTPRRDAGAMAAGAGAHRRTC